MPRPYQPNSEQPKSFDEIIKEFHSKAFNVTSMFPVSYLQASRDLIDRLLAKGASIDEARIAIQRLNNEWGLIRQE